jgi:LysR family transcriptional regulator (chromosome initiation inhibitor)
MLNAIDYPALAALAAVLRHGSFERAAAELHVTPSAVSQRIKVLEERLGTVLILRGQPCYGTEAGKRLARHVEEVSLLESALARDLGQAPTHAPIRIALNADSLATWVVPALVATEGLLFDVILDDQDHSADWLRRGEVTAAITSHTTPVQGCDAIALGSLRYLPTASPAFVARWFPDGPTPEALAKAPALTFNSKDRLQRAWAEAEVGRPVALTTHFLPSTTAFVEAALLGLGWGMNPEPLVRDHLAQGRLVALSDRPVDTPLTWQWSRLMTPALGPLTGAIRKAAARVLVA